MLSRLDGRLRGLPASSTRDLVVERGLEVPMRDGIVLLADRWAPRAGGAGLPVALVRSPYGRVGSFSPRTLAERGFQVIGQSVRGTSGSGGVFDAGRERDDGLDTLDWIVAQEWFGGSVVLAGVSYLGFTQWAMASGAPAVVKAMIPTAGDSAFLAGDPSALETPFVWGLQLDELSVTRRRFALARQLVSGRRYQRALTTLPLTEADVAAVGRPVPAVRDRPIPAVDGRPAPAFQDRPVSAVRGRSVSAVGDRPFGGERRTETSVPASVIGGWYDPFLPGQLRDFAALPPGARLTVGPWTHASPKMNAAALREVLDFGLPHAHGAPPEPRAPVRLFVTGADAWRDFASWPPAGFPDRRFHLHPDGELAEPPPPVSEPDGYRYDPNHPTPAVGGVRIALTGRRGRARNDALERRPDVLTFTTPALTDDAEVVGPVRAEVWFRSSRPYADVFVRLCDVDPRGRSWNVCDGLTSVAGADRTSRVRVELWPTAYRFRAGHRIRVQVSSGAFPRYHRNPGTGEPPATAVELHAADQLVFHDPERPSAIILPMAPAPVPRPPRSAS